MKALSIVLATGLVLATTSAAAARLFWIYGTGTATAHDKQLAYQLAFDDATRRAHDWCSGVFTGAQEAKKSYARIEETGEWKATVTIRDMCNGIPVMPSNPRNGGGIGAP